MKILRIFFSIILLFTVTGLATAETQWINNITINEYNISWGYTEVLTDLDSIAYRMNLDSTIGNNDSFINAWELLKADQDARKKFKNDIEKEPGIRINNETSGIELIDVNSSLSQAIIGKTNISDTVENRFGITYRLKESIYNASSIWFLGEPESPVTIILPAGIDILGISGIDNETGNTGSNTKITGYFSNLSNRRGEITVNITKNASYTVNSPESNLTEATSNESNENITKPASEISKKIREWGIVGTGIVFIILIYFFKIRKN